MNFKDDITLGGIIWALLKGTKDLILCLSSWPFLIIVVIPTAWVASFAFEAALHFFPYFGYIPSSKIGFFDNFVEINPPTSIMHYNLLSLALSKH